MDETKLLADWPSLRVEIAHRRSREDNAEYLSVTLRAVPSVEPWQRWLEMMTPLGFWSAAAAFAPWSPLMQFAWSPWRAPERSRR